MCSNRGTSGVGVTVRVEGKVGVKVGAEAGGWVSVMAGTVGEITTGVGGEFGIPQAERSEAKSINLYALFIEYLEYA